MAHFLCHLGCSHFGALLLDFYFTENRPPEKFVGGLIVPDIKLLFKKTISLMESKLDISPKCVILRIRKVNFPSERRLV